MDEARLLFIMFSKYSIRSLLYTKVAGFLWVLHFPVTENVDRVVGIVKYFTLEKHFNRFTEPVKTIIRRKTLFYCVVISCDQDIISGQERVLKEKNKFFFKTCIIKIKDILIYSPRMFV